MAATTLQRPSVQAPDIRNDDLYEVIDGKRVELTVGIYSVMLASQLFKHLAVFLDDVPIGRAVAEGLFHLPAPFNRDRRPDVAFVSYERWSKTRSLPRTDNAWDVVPNVTVEVVSPTDSIYELEQKIAEYFQVGVEMVWVVYPSQSKIHVLASPTQIQVLTTHDVLDGGTLLPGFRLPVNELFVEPAEDQTSA